MKKYRYPEYHEIYYIAEFIGLAIRELEEDSHFVHDAKEQEPDNLKYALACLSEGHRMIEEFLLKIGSWTRAPEDPKKIKEIRENFKKAYAEK